MIVEFYGPYVAAAAIGLQMLGSMQQAQADQTEAQASADDLNLQASLAETSGQRDIRDERERTRIELARMRARMSAYGNDAGLGLGTFIGGESILRQKRIKTDTSIRAATLRTRATNLRTSAGTTKNASILGAGGQGLSMFSAQGS